MLFYLAAKVAATILNATQLKTSFGKMAKPDSIPDAAYVFAAKRRKGKSKDPNPDSFLIDIPFLMQRRKSKLGSQKNLDELHVAYSERSVNKFLSWYFYETESKCLYRKS